MPLTLEPLTIDDTDLLLALVRDPSLAAEFELITSPVAIRSMLGDPFGLPSARWLALCAGEPVGFLVTFVLPSWQGRWAMLRIGVREDHRRRRVASSLLEEAIAVLRRAAPDCAEVCTSAWMPNPNADGFAAHHGFRHERWFWLMEHPAEPPPAPAWPAGTSVRTFDGSERAVADWNDAYNAAFREHYRGVRSDPEHVRELAAQPDFHGAGLLLAYRDGRCVGFCRNELNPERGEVGSLGVIPEARGLGLGRALLRWGVAWLGGAGATRFTLMVDGENETALSLYRSERFEPVRTRRIWSRPVA